MHGGGNLEESHLKVGDRTIKELFSFVITLDLQKS